MSHSSRGIILLGVLLAVAAAPVDQPPKPPAWLAGYRVRWPVRAAGVLEKIDAKSVIVAIPTGGWLKPDGSDLAVQTADGKALPVHIVSHDPNGDTIIQFPRDGANRWYWVSGVNAAAAPASGEPMKEGVSLEVRAWAGERLDSWAEAVEGLKKSETLIGNSVVMEIVQVDNPLRPTQSRKFAASYRGYLNITTSGTYRFLANADDAAFLFIDGFKVFERPGANERLRGKLPVGTGGATIELTNGVHAIEVHHVMGANPGADGACVLMWVRPGEKSWQILPHREFVKPVYAVAGPPAEASGAPLCSYSWGIDDVLLTQGLNLFLARFEAVGSVAKPDALVWDMGDGTTRRGRSIQHVYFNEGEYTVTLKSGDGLPVFTRRVFVWPAFTSPTPNPLILPRAVAALREMDWKKFKVQDVVHMFQLLESCGQTNHWALQEAVGRQLLTQTGLDSSVRLRVYRGLMTALAEQGRAKEALQTSDQALTELGKVSTFEVALHLARGDIHYRYLKDLDAAVKEYRQIVDRFARLDAPEVRLAAVRLGDLAVDLGDTTGAAEMYRLAAQLGGRQFESTEVTDAVKRGATLRIVEQRLRAGRIDECRASLEQIERESPEQKLQGVYSFLRAEVDRAGGRYEEAIGGYERVLRQMQWAGLHDRALFGMAEAYGQLGKLDRTKEIVAKLKEAFPQFYTNQNLAAYERTLGERLARPAGEPGTPDLSVKPLTADFETDVTGAEEIWGCAPAQGMAGPRVWLMDNMPTIRNNLSWRRNVTHLNPLGWYWAEVWYRCDAEAANAAMGFQRFEFYLLDRKDERLPEGMNAINVPRSYNRWQKVGGLVRAPQSSDGKVWLHVDPQTGNPMPHVLELDALSIEPVSDRQAEALHNFIRQQGGAL